MSVNNQETSIRDENVTFRLVLGEFPKALADKLKAIGQAQDPKVERNAWIEHVLAEHAKQYDARGRRLRQVTESQAA